MTIKHLPGKHNQKLHGHGTGSSSFSQALSGQTDSLAWWEKLSSEEKDRYADAPNSIDERLKTELAFAGEPDLVGTVDDVVAKRLKQVGDYVMQDAKALATKHLKTLGNVLSAAGVSEAKVKSIMLKATDALVIQEHEALSRQLGDHGIRHLLGDAAMAEEILSVHPAVDAPAQTALSYLAAIYHDTGYLTDPGSVMRMDGRHPAWSQQYFDKHVRPEIVDSLGESAASRLSNIIATHADSSIDWKNDPGASAFRIADNLALFHKEKLPGLFKYVPSNIVVLKEMGEGKITVEEAKARMAKNVRKSNLPGTIKETLGFAVNEVGKQTVKFTVGMLGGDVRDFKWDNGYLNVTVNRNRQAVELQKTLDLGQRQFKKFAEAYLGESGVKTMQSNGFVFRSASGRPLLKFDIIGEFLKSAVILAEVFKATNYVVD